MIRLHFLMPAVLLTMTTPPAAAQNYTWTGAGVAVPPFDGINWSNQYNWQGNAMPVSNGSAIITFSASTGQSTNNLGTFSLNFLTFNAAISLSGNTLSFSDSGPMYSQITQASSGPVTVSNNLYLNVGPAGLLVGGPGTGSLILSGQVSGGGSLQIEVGNFTTVLSNGGNSYTGGTLVGDSVRTDASGALPVGQSVEVQAGTLNLNGFNQSIGALLLKAFAMAGPPAPSIMTGTGTLTLGGDVTFTASSIPTTATISGHLNLGATTRTFFIDSGGAAADLAISAAITGAGGVTKAGAGILALSGSNGYSGGTIVQNGTLRTDIAGALPSGGTVTVQGGTLNLNGSSQSIGGLNLQASTVIGDPGPVVLTGSGALTLGGDVTFVRSALPLGAIINGNLNLGATTRTFNIGFGGASADTAVGAAITGSGGLTKTGAGILALSGFNSYSGGTTILSGTLRTDNFAALPAGGAVTVQAGTLNLNGANQSIGVLTLSDPSTTFASQAPVVQTGAGILTLGGDVTFNPGTNASPGANIGNLNLGGATRNFNIGFGANTYDTVISGIISGTGGLTKIGGGNLALTGGTSYSGPTTLTAGILFLGVVNALPSAVVVNGGLLIFDPNPTTQGVTAGNYSQSFGSLAGTGGLVLLGSASLTVGTDNTNTAYAGSISGTGSLVKTGTGTLSLTGTNNYSGGTTVANGTLAVSSDTAFGMVAAPVTITPFGTLLYTANSSTARTLNLNNGTLSVSAGATLTLNGAYIGGGFLHGPGTFAVTGGAVLAGVTTFGSTTISQTGPASFVNFTNGGSLTLAAGLPIPTPFSAFTNNGGGAIAIAAGSAVNAADFQSYGTLTLTPATSNGKTLLTNVGTSPLYFNGGSRTFIGTVGGNGQAQLELNGQNAIVAGGLLVNNGMVTDNSAAGISTVIADYGALVKGAGQYDNSPQTQNGGKFQAGNSPGVATVGRFVFGPGGVSNYVFAIDDATGQAGPTPDVLGHVSGWGLVKAAQWQRAAGATSGDFVWTADVSHPLTVAIDTLVNPTTVGIDVPGLMADFDPSRSYSWPAVQWTGTYSGPSDVTSLDAATNFDTSGFANPIEGTFGWSLSSSSLSLNYTPNAVPEPGTLALVGFAAAAGWWRRRRITVSSI